MGVINILSKDSKAYQFLELVAAAGEYPASGLDLVMGEGRYKEKIINELKEEGYIKVFYKDKLRGYRITAASKKLLLNQNRDRFEFYLKGKTETNYRKSEVSRRQRLHRMAEIHALLFQSGVCIWRDRKPSIFKEIQKIRYPPHLNSPVYYSSREIKEVGLETIKVKNSRAIGIVINLPDTYVIYHTGNNIMRWQYNSELRMKAVVSFLLKSVGVLITGDMENIKAIMVGSNMNMAYQLMTSDGGYQKGCFRLDTSFQTMHYIPADLYGVFLLKILLNPSIIQELSDILSTDLIRQSEFYGMEINAVDKQGTPVLYAFAFDMIKIAKFQAALKLRCRNGIMICFDFQKDALKRYCDDRIEIQTIDSSKVERRFFSE